MKTHLPNLRPLGIALALAFGLSFIRAARADSWTTNAPLIAARAQHTATLLPSGKVLVAGGTPDGSAELYDPSAGTSVPTGRMQVARLGHTATLLPNGKVLAAGGCNRNSTNWEDHYWLASAELYDPGTGTWTPTGSLNRRRNGHTMTLLTNGTVLVAGGIAAIGGAINSAELYLPEAGIWVEVGALSDSRYGHTATLLPDGRVLVAGGMIGTVPPPYAELFSAELYDPATGFWSVTGSLNFARSSHTATLLRDGRVLAVAGDSSYNGIASTEVYSPSNGTWAAGNPLFTARDGHTATLLSSGKVLIAGGSDTNLNQLASTELFDPASGTWDASAGMNEARESHVATLLTNGLVLVTGGYCAYVATRSTEVYDSLTVPVPTPVRLTGAKILSDGSFQFTFTNSPGTSFIVVAATNAALPSGHWTWLGYATQVGAGQFQFTDPQATNKPQRFYRVRSQ